MNSSRMEKYGDRETKPSVKQKPLDCRRFASSSRCCSRGGARIDEDYLSEDLQHYREIEAEARARAVSKVQEVTSRTKNPYFNGPHGRQ